MSLEKSIIITVWKNYEIMLTIAIEKFQFSTHSIFHLINVAFVKPCKIIRLGNWMIRSGE